jgi:hypothetical protein
MEIVRHIRALARDSASGRRFAAFFGTKLPAHQFVRHLPARHDLTGVHRSVTSAFMWSPGIISTLVRALACLVLALSIVFFPPSVVLASPVNDAAEQAQSWDVSASETDKASHRKNSRHTSLAECGSDLGAAHSDFGPNQCCSGVCLTDIMLEDRSVRNVQVTGSLPVIDVTQLTHFDPNGLLRPPRLLI